MKTIEVKAPYGRINGIDNEDYAEFRGIRYAEAERFAYPSPVTSYDGIYDATEWGACSYQRRAFENDAECNAFYHREFREGLEFTYSEDSLFLNIWAPKEGKKCPVIVYIHGGSFTGGSGNEAHLNGSYFAKNGVVFVTFNYRLGPFGFISHPDLKDEKGRCGNYGLYDQTVALQWVKVNIEAFGGDSDNITLMGQSAGAMSVDIQLSNKLAKGLFNKAIMMSGAGLQRFIMKPVKPDDSKTFWDLVIKNAGVGSAKELKELDPKTLYYAWFDAQKQMKGTMKYTLPVADGEIITDDSYNSKTIPDMPYILGVTTEDMIPAALEFATRKWANICQKHNKKCYVYIFSRALPGDEMGAWHACDILYALMTLDISWRPFEDADRRLAKEMASSFMAFAKNGNPNCDTIPCWDDNYKRPMQFCENTQPGKWDTKRFIKNTINNKGPV